MRKSICVFAGSSPGRTPQFAQAARDLGREIAARGYGLVYGGASVGLMGLVADAALAAGGHVTGVIPSFLAEKELSHAGLSELRVVETMHERKQVMASLSHAFVALPGGFGTLEEFFEVLTWAQLGLHDKPCALLDVCGYYQGLLQFLDNALAEQLLRSAHRSMVLVASEPQLLLESIENYRAPAVAKWLEPGAV